MQQVIHKISLLGHSLFLFNQIDCLCSVLVSLPLILSSTLEKSLLTIGGDDLITMDGLNDSLTLPLLFVKYSLVNVYVLL